MYRFYHPIPNLSFLCVFQVEPGSSKKEAFNKALEKALEDPKGLAAKEFHEAQEEFKGNFYS